MPRKPHNRTGFGRTIHDLRMRRGLSIAELAERLEVTAAYVSRIELNQAPPSDALLQDLAVALECKEEEIFLAAGRVPPSVRAAYLADPSAFDAVVAGFSPPADANPLDPDARKRLKKKLQR